MIRLEVTEYWDKTEIEVIAENPTEEDIKNLVMPLVQFQLEIVLIGSAPNWVFKGIKNRYPSSVQIKRLVKGELKTIR